MLQEQISATLTGLKKFTNYSITVFASTAKEGGGGGGGAGGRKSEPIIVITDEDRKNSQFWYYPVGCYVLIWNL